MPRVSKIPLSEDMYRDLNDSFVGVVSDLVKPDEVENFLKDFLTFEERLMLSKRLVLALLIKEKYSPTEIKDILKVSRTTINHMKHWLSYKNGIGIGVDRLLSKRRKSRLNEKELGVLKHIPPLTRNKKAMAKWLNR